MVKYLGKRTVDFMLAGYDGLFTVEEKQMAEAAKKGEVEYSLELEALYAKAARPMREIFMKDGKQTSKYINVKDKE